MYQHTKPHNHEGYTSPFFYNKHNNKKMITQWHISILLADMHIDSGMRSLENAIQRRYDKVHLLSQPPVMRVLFMCVGTFACHAMTSPVSFSLVHCLC